MKILVKIQKKEMGNVLSRIDFRESCIIVHERLTWRDDSWEVFAWLYPSSLGSPEGNLPCTSQDQFLTEYTRS
jgi:hypothetical protein